MKTVGRIFEHEDRIVVDAEPHVMSRIRSLFNSSIGATREMGKYTHKPLSLPNTLNVCRDIQWLLTRYPMEYDQPLMDIINRKGEEYDNILKAVMDADIDTNLKISREAMPFAIELRDHQIAFNNMARKIKKMLLADTMGVGKTFSALSLLSEPENRPAIIVVPTTLPDQWERQIKRIFPDMTTHIIRGFKNYELPDVDVIITTYNRLAPWQDVLLNPKKKFSTAIFDEIQELRHTGTSKRAIASQLSKKCEYAIGLSGTPIYNMGYEIWSVVDAIKENSLGDISDFTEEWCTWNKVNEPTILNAYLKNMGLMLRRTKQDIGLTASDVMKDVITIDADLEKLKEVKNVAKTLALSVLSGRIGENSDAARDFDWKLRMATGVAKARPVAEFVRMVAESEGKVIVTGWHREFWDILQRELKDLKPVMFTGSETTPQKEKALKSFIEGDSQLFFMSLRSGAGIDGLQQVCNTVIHGELDWSPHVMDQLNARVDRDGQTKPVSIYYVTIADGSDPFIMQLLNVKRSQHDGVIEGKDAEGVIVEAAHTGHERIREMAKAYLNSIGEEIPVVLEEVGLLKDVAEALRRLKLPANTEDEMQRAIDSVLPGMLPGVNIQREYKISARSRLDFFISNETEKIAVECKIHAKNRAEVYRQVRKYSEEAGITSVVLIAPWHGIASFYVDGIPVVVIDTSIASI